MGADACAGRASILLLGPARTAVSGVSTHVNQLFESSLSEHYRLAHYQVGSEGRAETRWDKLLRAVTTPFGFMASTLASRAQIVHVNTSLETPKGWWRDVVYFALAKALGRKVVYQVHGGLLPQQFFAGQPLGKAVFRWILRSADAVVLLAASEIEAYREFAPNARVVRIANAVALESVATLHDKRYREARPLEIVYLGRLAASKGIFETVEAVRLLTDRGVELRLRIAGAGGASEEIRAAIAAARLEDRVQLVGSVFGAGKQQLWHDADVFAFPTYHCEGLPYALLEAMAAGAVPVVSPVGAIPDVMQDEVHGLIVPPHDPQAVAAALARLAVDRALLERLGLAARERIVGHYSIGRMAAEFDSIYARLAKPAAGTA
jgi:glycosyltransferase involved in cell wall biosynthesis